jgi:hypothetical protein
MTEIRRRKTELISDSDIIKSHWNKIKGGEVNCFVCDKKFKAHHNKKYIGKHKLTGEILLRHDYCESGSNNWEEKFGGRITFNTVSNSKIKEKQKSKKELKPTTIIKRRKRI